MVLRFKFVLCVGLILALSVGFSSNHSQAYAAVEATPQYYSMTYTASGDTTKYNYVKVFLSDSGTKLVPQGANNKLPVNDSNWEPRWSPSGNAIQNLLNMYNGSGVSGRIAMINTDYFCRSGCSGHSGSPQGLFVKNGTVYHKAPQTTVRAALKFTSYRQASIGAMGWSSSTSGIYNSVSGGPIVLQNGTITCNPEGSDLGYRCGSTLQARSAACISSDGYTLWLITNANGYTTNWNNLASFMKNQLGCYNGMQFDGGSSVNMVVGTSQVSQNGDVGSGLIIGYTGGCNPCLINEPLEMPDTEDTK